ncbi:hypothetical protein VTP01DRAFT_7039 [Rhizomucor pusillus]|uniref:uncharacterized protein n=1 Tax=Rhizomucor pusillus TaxID=4840 RepID=UPI003742FD34
MSTLYVGNLPPNVSTRELRSLVSKYGRVHRIESKGSFAFLEMDSRRDCEDAIDRLRGTKFLGFTLRVELARSDLRPEPLLTASSAVNKREVCFTCGGVGHYTRDCPSADINRHRIKLEKEPRTYGDSYRPSSSRHPSVRAPLASPPPPPLPLQAPSHPRASRLAPPPPPSYYSNARERYEPIPPPARSIDHYGKYAEPPPRNTVSRRRRSFDDISYASGHYGNGKDAAWDRRDPYYERVRNKYPYERRRTPPPQPRPFPSVERYPARRVSSRRSVSRNGTRRLRSRSPLRDAHRNTTRRSRSPVRTIRREAARRGPRTPSPRR